MIDKQDMFYRIIDVFNEHSKLYAELEVHDDNRREYSLIFYFKGARTEAQFVYISLYSSHQTLEELISNMLNVDSRHSIFNICKIWAQFNYHYFADSERLSIMREIGRSKAGHILSDLARCKNLDELELEMTLKGI